MKRYCRFGSVKRALFSLSLANFHTYLTWLLSFWFVIRSAYSFCVSIVRNDLIEFDSFICWTNSFVFVWVFVVDAVGICWLLFLFIAAFSLCCLSCTINISLRFYCMNFRSTNPICKWAQRRRRWRQQRRQHSKQRQHSSPLHSGWT